MSEQTANLCTTDACESLRARLAKYEDAEGNPKAQPSGVVLPDHERAKLVNTLRDCAKTYSGTDQLRAQIATVIGQFIPLNSSPVSEAEPDYCDGPEFKGWAQRSGVDARAAFEAAYSGEYGTPLSVLTVLRNGDVYLEKPHHSDRLNSSWWMWKKARAALTASAPNHSEQVRDVSEMARVLSDRQADACNVDRDDQWKIYGQDFIEDVTAMLAAAPSAGSQKEQE